MRGRGVPVIFMLIVTLLAVACAEVPSIKGRKRADALQASINTYRKLIRWGHFDEAVKYLRAEDDSEIKVDLTRTNRYRVTSYEISDQLLADTGTAARVTAVIEYYEIDSGVLKGLRDEQYWWYDEEGKRWFLGSALPAFGSTGR